MIIYNYITTNTLNGKQYVGMHSTDDIDDEYLGSGRAFLKAVKKYGKENFTREILGFCPDVSVAFANEEKYIAEYNTLSPNGYNLSPTGGLGTPGCHSDKTLKKMSKTAKNMTEETRKKLSEAAKNPSKEVREKMGEKQRGINNHMYGQKHSEEIKRKIGEATRERIVSEKTKQKKSRIVKEKKITCPHCEKEDIYLVMHRWHFDNCKQKKVDIYKNKE